MEAAVVAEEAVVAGGEEMGGGGGEGEDWGSGDAGDLVPMEEDAEVADSTVVRVDEGSALGEVPAPEDDVEVEFDDYDEGGEELGEEEVVEEGGMYEDTRVDEGGGNGLAPNGIAHGREVLGGSDTIDRDGREGWEGGEEEGGVVEDSFEANLCAAQRDARAAANGNAEDFSQVLDAANYDAAQLDGQNDTMTTTTTTMTPPVANGEPELPSIPAIPEKLEDFALPAAIATEVKYFTSDAAKANYVPGEFEYPLYRDEEIWFASYVPYDLNVDVLADLDLGDEDGGEETAASEEDGEVLCTAWLDARTLATARGDGTVAIWDVKTQKKICSFLPYPRNDPVFFLASLSGLIDAESLRARQLKMLTVSGASRTLRIWDIEGNEAVLVRSMNLPKNGSDISMVIPLVPRPPATKKELSFSTFNEYEQAPEQVPEPAAVAATDAAKPDVFAEEGEQVVVEGEAEVLLPPPTTATTPAAGDEKASARELAPMMATEEVDLAAEYEAEATPAEAEGDYAVAHAVATVAPEDVVGVEEELPAVGEATEEELGDAATAAAAAAATVAVGGGAAAIAAAGWKEADEDAAEETRELEMDATAGVAAAFAKDEVEEEVLAAADVDAAAAVAPAVLESVRYESDEARQHALFTDQSGASWIKPPSVDADDAIGATDAAAAAAATAEDLDDSGVTSAALAGATALPDRTEDAASLPKEEYLSALESFRSRELSEHAPPLPVPVPVGAVEKDVASSSPPRPAAAAEPRQVSRGASGNVASPFMGSTTTGAVGIVEEESTAKGAFGAFQAGEAEETAAKKMYEEQVMQRKQASKTAAAAVGAVATAAAAVGGGAALAATAAADDDDADDEIVEQEIEEEVIEEEEVEIDESDDAYGAADEGDELIEEEEEQELEELVYEDLSEDASTAPAVALAAASVVAAEEEAEEEETAKVETRMPSVSFAEDVVVTGGDDDDDVPAFAEDVIAPKGSVTFSDTPAEIRYDDVEEEEIVGDGVAAATGAVTTAAVASAVFVGNDDDVDEEEEEYEEEIQEEETEMVVAEDGTLEALVVESVSVIVETEEGGEVVSREEREVIDTGAEAVVDAELDGADAAYIEYSDEYAEHYDELEDEEEDLAGEEALLYDDEDDEDDEDEEEEDDDDYDEEVVEEEIEEEQEEDIEEYSRR